MSQSIRERVAELETQMANAAQTPDSTRSALVALTGLLGKAASHLRSCELAYKRVLAMRAGVGDLPAVHARIACEATEEYATYREALDVWKSIDQMIKTCRAYLRSLDEEMRLSGR